MAKKKDRVIIDTNLWISFLLTKDTYKLDKLFSDESLILLFSPELLDEFIEVASRPKFKKYFSIIDLEDLLQQINVQAEFIRVTSTIELCRDSKDNFLLSLAKDGEANYLLTGDSDLLSLRKIGKTRIQTLAEYTSGKSSNH